jgi:hypothetical protein
MCIIYRHLSYRDALFVSGLERLRVRREKITRDLYNDVQQSNHLQHNLLPSKPNDNFDIRDTGRYICMSNLLL